jgi:hypothetical protein
MQLHYSALEVVTVPARTVGGAIPAIRRDEVEPVPQRAETLYLGAQSDRTHLSAGHLNRHGWLERFLAPLLLLQ